MGRIGRIRPVSETCFAPPPNREVFVAEGWAVELGTFEWALTRIAGGSPVIGRSNYMQVWKRAVAFAREVWNSPFRTDASLKPSSGSAPRSV